MELIISSNDVVIWDTSKDLEFKENFKINTSAKAVAINQFDNQTFGILDTHDLLKIYSFSGDNKNLLSLKSKTNCFSFYNTSVVTGDTSGNIHLYNVPNKTNKPLFRTNDGIVSICVSPNEQLLYCRHKSGGMSHFNIKSDKTNLFQLDKTVSTFDVSRWSSQVTLLGCDCGLVARYDIDSECMISLWKHHKAAIASVAFSLHNKHLALSVSKDRKATLLACDKSDVIQTFSLPNLPTACSFSDDYAFAIGDETGIVSLFDVRMKNAVNQIQTNGKVDFVGFIHKDVPKFDQRDISFKSRVFRETQNLTDSLSGNSLFSGDGSVDTSSGWRQNLDLSEFMGSVNENVDVKRSIKQVKFQEPVSNNRERCIPLTNISQKRVISDTAFLSDEIVIRKIVADEIKKELSTFQYIMQNNLIFGIVDQLKITEDNIVTPLQSLLQQNQSLIEENEMLRQELRRCKYNI